MPSLEPEPDPDPEQLRPDPEPLSPGGGGEQLHHDCDWYWPDISRARAEQLLTADHQPDGRFLVRDSTSAPGDFVLSVVVDQEVVHYQIQQHGLDAFFSIDEGPLIHGLDALVEHYTTSAELPVRLTDWPRGAAPPAAARLHGASTLLHRATEAGDVLIVCELLKSGYSQLNSKDAAGQTALHVAARLGRAEVLQLLLQARCHVHVRDKAGLLPLHYAARRDGADAVRQLVAAGADLQARAAPHRWVPLHEAAHCGAQDAVKTLLALRAPARPRDADDRTPAQLALRAGHRACAALLARYKPPVPRRLRSDWLHGTLSRAQAEARLRAGGFNGGDYLLRTSARQPGRSVLSMVHEQRVFHFEIKEAAADDGASYVFIDDGPYLESLEHLVEHYSTLADGLQCRLRHPVPPSDEDARRAISDSRRSVLGAPVAPPLPQPRLPRPGLISPGDLEFGAVIGGGQFGKVYQGRWRDPHGRLVDVAIKTHQPAESESESADGGQRELLLREAACLEHLRHPCIVRFIGVVPHQPLMMVQELVPLGSLLDFLHEQPQGASLEPELKLWAGQVAAGMEYLERRRLVHRDLAARNILLASRTQAKISDFGFSRRLAADRDYYVAAEGGRWPIKWYAPEAINFGTFGAQSDVWSFGVLLWEMFSYGQQPYGDLPGVQAFLEVVERGGRLEMPDFCPGGIYELMLKCWAYAPEERPTFAALHRFFSTDAVYKNISDLGTPQAVSLTSTLTVNVADAADEYAAASDAATVVDEVEPAADLATSGVVDPNMDLPASAVADANADAPQAAPASQQLYDVLASSPPASLPAPPPVPPKPTRKIAAPTVPSEVYDSPRSHRIETPNKPVNNSESVKEKVGSTEVSAERVSGQAPLSPLSAEEAGLLRRPPAAVDISQPADEEPVSIEGEQEAAPSRRFTERRPSAAEAAAAAAAEQREGAASQDFSEQQPSAAAAEYCRVAGAAAAAAPARLCPDYTRPLLADVDQTYAVPVGALGGAAESEETYDVPAPLSETYDVPTSPCRQVAPQ